MDALLPVGSRSLAVAAAALSLAVHSSPPAAQTAADATTAGTPRIGLALSGGGARGLAHVGVLKVLEEMRVPISCVTGTSMGAIVGGTFAAGRTPAEMEKLVLGADWDGIFRDQPPRQEIAVKRKIDDYKTLFKPEFGVSGDGLSLPKGVIAGVSIDRSSACWRPRRSVSTTSGSSPSPSARWRPTSRPVSRSCSNTGTSPRQCADTSSDWEPQAKHLDRSLDAYTPAPSTPSSMGALVP